MPDFAAMRMEELIRPEGFDCPCGKHHACAMDYLKIGPGAVKTVGAMVGKMGCQKPFVLCDRNTYEAAGELVDRLLSEAGIAHRLYIIPCAGQKIAPAEWEIGSAIMHFDPSCDLILGVGSGVINDICKVIGNALGKKSAIVGTAPSMDGYASNSSAMEINHVKMTLFNRAPKGMILDTDILARAPMRMLWAGLGDMAAKYIALCEWRMSSLVTGEYYCEDVARLMRSALKKVMDAAEGIPERKPEAIQSIAEGLVISGIAMAYAEISRPASGLEHYFSHLWEMMALERGQPYDLHGIQVGIGTILTMKLYRKFRQITPDRNRANAYWQAMTNEKWEARIREIFGKTAPEIIEMERKGRKNDPAAHQERLDRIIENWDGIMRAVDEELPDEKALRGLMEKVGMPTRPSEIGVSVRDTVNAFIGARDARMKYMSCSLLWDLGLTDEFAEYLRGVAEE
ncbi:MAG: sn-glycerol-1-phosphate dehydrogenase [Clostridia bacterium]|nr:sn-glycerol-1-phosphate dehydrogenase [Clostridia bacterium]